LRNSQKTCLLDDGIYNFYSSFILCLLFSELQGSVLLERGAMVNESLGVGQRSIQ
jgi:hypothetical protein